ncbi:hypothetical protein ACJJTC_013574 [Scirpophaga incertulas]
MDTNEIDISDVPEETAPSTLQEITQESAPVHVEECEEEAIKEQRGPTYCVIGGPSTALAGTLKIVLVPGELSDTTLEECLPLQSLDIDCSPPTGDEVVHTIRSLKNGKAP